MILFLDFDGVLHPSSPTKKGVGYFHNMSVFEDLMKVIPEVKIVISSSWREEFVFADLVQFFPEWLQPNIIGVTPIFSVGSFKTNFWRHEEIQEWIKDNNYKEHWVALDDAHKEFPDGCHNFVRINPDTGIVQSDLGFIKYVVFNSR